jgi:hypothetical protein
LREVLPDDLGDLFVRKVTSGNEESLVRSVCFLECGHMGFSNVTNVYPNMHPCGRYLVLEFALCGPQNSLI